MTITTRAGKGSELTHAELDTNFTDLRDGVGMTVPKAKTAGIGLGNFGDRTYAWHDLLGHLFVPDYSLGTAPSLQTYIGGIKEHLFAVNDEAQVRFHLPHDYYMGSHLHIHAHWSHNSSLVTGGSVTWGFELTYAKGHQQGAFSTPVVVTEQQNASTTQRFHMVCEAPISLDGGSANMLDTTLIEVDGMIFGRVYLVANNITVSSGPVPDVFLHEVDIHYQTTNVGTKRRSPDFWV
jgi:hypothetical protein